MHIGMPAAVKVYELVYYYYACIMCIVLLVVL